MTDLFLWLAFGLLVLGTVALDLGLSHRDHRPMPLATAVRWSLLWIGVAVAFGIALGWFRGVDSAIAFFTGYLIEEALSVDNLFVFLAIFTRLRVPEGQRHRVLTWGILGAWVLRAVMIFGGIRLLALYHPVIYLFGAFLVATGLKTLVDRWGAPPDKASADDGEPLRVIGFVRRLIPITSSYEESRFFTRVNGRLAGTPLLLALIVVELADVVFAVDSIPAILAITNDPLIVYSSNILAILGLRAMFFVIADLITRLRYLGYGLGALLILIGAKMLLSSLIHIPPFASLSMTVSILSLTVVASLAHKWRNRPPAA